MTQEETIQVLQSIEDRAVDFPYMTACDWVAIAAAKRYLENSINTKEVNLEEEYDDFQDLTLARLVNRNAGIVIAKHFFELGLKVKGE